MTTNPTTTTPKKGEKRVTRQYVSGGQRHSYADSEEVFIAYPERFIDGEWQRQEVTQEEFEAKWLRLATKAPREKDAGFMEDYLGLIIPKNGGFQVTVISPYNG